MKGNKSIQLKSVFLLVVFSLNTIIGFACSIGIDMGFNAKDHHGEEATEAAVHVHANGEKHIHDKETSKHHHDETRSDHHKSTDGKDNCCNDKVVKISQLDKTVLQSVSVVIHPASFTAFLSSFYYINTLY